MMSFSPALRDTALQALAQRLDGTQLVLFAGEYPAIDTPLATVPLVAHVASEKVMITAAEALAHAQGQIGWGRIQTPQGVWLLDADAGLDAAIKVSQVQVYPGTTVQVTLMAVSLG